MEKLMLELDVGPAGAAWRVLVGAAFALALRVAEPDAGPGLAAAALLAVLFGIKAFAAVARKLVPAPQSVLREWERRRNLARFHDSYQWRKLVWFGAGIGIAATISGSPGWEIPVGSACLAAGALAEIVWRRKSIPVSPAVRGQP